VGGSAAESRARLTLLLGYAPGVGKTCALLEAGRRLRNGGTDVVAGFVQTRGRAGSAELLGGLEVLSGASVAHNDHSHAAFDVDAALERRPGVLLIDDIEQPNAPGSRNTRRWQDLVELLDAGISVLATLDVFRLESLSDVVLRITGVRIGDTVPDAVLERANDLLLVDAPPAEVAERGGRAGFTDAFRDPGRLAALRSLALRCVAERVDRDILAHRRRHGVDAAWPTSELVLAGVGPSPASAGVIRAAARLAASLQARWSAVTVESRQPPSAAGQRRLEEHLRLAQSLGGEVVRLSGRGVAEALLSHAYDRNATRIVVGRPTRSRLRDFLRGSIVDTLVRESGGIEVHVVALAEDQMQSMKRGRTNPPPVPWAGFALALALVAAVTGVASLARAILPDTEIVMGYLLAIMIVAFFYGRGPALAAAGLSVAAYDVFFVPPLYQFTVDDVRHVLTFAMMFAVGLVISSLTATLRRQSSEARLRERRTADLYALVRALADAGDAEDAAAIGARHAAAVTGMEATMLLRIPGGPDSTGTPGDGDEGLDEGEATVARWVFEHNLPAGRGTDTHAGSAVLCLPVATGMAALGVLVLRPAGRQPPDAEQRAFLEVFVRQIALALERIRLGGEARAAGLRARAEEIRSSLLSSVSHDLRTPLAAITGAATALRVDRGRLDPALRTELLETVCDEAGRMDRLIGDLLDMVRLEAGRISLRREWVPLEEIVGSALHRLEPRLEGRDLAVDLPADLPLVLVDPVLFEHLLHNLVENALKHTSGPVEVSAMAAEGHVVIDVADRGPGIPPGAEQKVFERFYRGPAARGPGMGLGLSICRSIVQIHDGSISVERRSGGGAVFRIRLPMLEGPPAIDPRADPPPELRQ
jgi:two-component system sensor histidine kinase KdpD